MWICCKVHYFLILVSKINWDYLPCQMLRQIWHVWNLDMYIGSFVFCVLAAETELQLSANQKSARLDLDKKGAKNHDLQL